MRILFALLFGLLALFSAVGYMEALTTGGSLEPISHLVHVLRVVLPGLTSLYLFWPPAALVAAMQCPACRERATLEPSVLLQPRPSAVALFFGGVIFTLLIQHSRPSRFRCKACGAPSTRRTLGAWLTLSWCFASLGLLLVAMMSL